MKDFEEFKASRLAKDPTTRKYTRDQWEKAYAAYQRSRGGRGDGEGGGSGARRPGPSPESELHAVRAATAYAQTRSLITLLFWIAVAVIAVAFLIRAAIIIDNEGALIAVVVSGFNAALSVVVALVLRLLAEVLVDLSDTGLYRMAREATEEPKAGASGLSSPDTKNE